MSIARILLIEDDANIRRFIAIALRNADFEVFEADTCMRALVEASTRRPDLAIVDLGLPDADGKAFIRELRSWSEIPVLVLSAREREEEKVAALDAGADDYLVKPFGVPELLARLRAMLRRRTQADSASASSVVSFGDIEVNLATHEVSRRGAPVKLTPIEFRLLAALIRVHGKVLTHRQLLVDVWGPGYSERTHHLRVHMANLRHKIEEDPAQPRYLITELQVGYRLLMP
jgi:two-component system KDP operon response regulator KdpE